MRTKDEFIRKFAEHTTLSLANSRTAWDGISKAMIDFLKSESDKAILPGIGYLEMKHRAARKGRNLQTGEVMEIPEKNIVAFKMTKTLKEEVNPKKKGR